MCSSLAQAVCRACPSLRGTPVFLDNTKTRKRNTHELTKQVLTCLACRRVLREVFDAIRYDDRMRRPVPCSHSTVRAHPADPLASAWGGTQRQLVGALFRFWSESTAGRPAYQKFWSYGSSRIYSHTEYSPLKTRVRTKCVFSA